MKAGLKSNADSGATLVELLASMAILSILVLILAMALEASLGQFRDGADKARESVSVDTAFQLMARDLVSVVASQPANLAPLPSSASDPQREFFEGRRFYPFEVNRESGLPAPERATFANAAQEFDSLAFATTASNSGTFRDQPNSQTSATTVTSIVGYYVAYARHSPLSAFPEAGMKLFRHLRPGGTHYGDHYATGYLLELDRVINDTWDEGGKARESLETNPAAIRNGKFRNSDLPFLLANRQAAFPLSEPVSGTLPYPLYAADGSFPVPTRGSDEAWTDRDDPIHDSVFPDEAICDHVVRFSLSPFKWVETSSGSRRALDAAELNDYLGLRASDEWPCLVTPDFIDIELAVVDPTTAARLSSREDWIVDWESSTSPRISEIQELIERGLQTHRFRLEPGGGLQ
ncbi:MAG: type II secretion system protein [Verrucomicrobiota bacterium]